ncbi:hypothetical protein E1295_27870 [Nonomuraea mesophila]|uniref:Uncharacterized protein n=1 Tax=Nonomuraea mesophila TaxID=2530382 RepID=A0A4R5F4A0_9ACTN|nr:hypothetical protein E1295_27870 [Nonomuraea mesophila]
MRSRLEHPRTPSPRRGTPARSCSSPRTTTRLAMRTRPAPFRRRPSRWRFRERPGTARSQSRQ